jgi:short-subunit dehydrogenase
MAKEVVVITGCSSGIGLESAIYLKERFIKVYPTARDEADVQRLKALGFSEAMRLDITKSEDIKSVIDRVLELEGKIDVWFNNAGYGQMGAIEDVPLNLVKRQFETNVFGLFEATQQIVKVMQKQGFGKIIQHSSVLGIVALPLRGVYNASKYAVEGFSDTLRLELKGSGVCVISLNTGPVTSKFRENAIDTLKDFDIESSRWSEAYKRSMGGNAKRVPFNLPAVEVAKIVHKIILSPKPKPRYYITKATWILGFAKRVLSTSMLDRLLLRV